jgi:two-component system nitrate/nitrite response regulator NarL
MRLILVDDHPIVLAGLERLFSTVPDFQVVARCQSGAQGVAATRGLSPDLLLLDLKLPDMSGLDVLRAVKQLQPAPRVVILSAAVMPQDVVTARDLGADGLLYKDLAPDDLVNEVRRAAAGLRPFPTDLPDDPMLARYAQLTARERDIVMAAARGLRNRAIADELGITEGTVKLHLHNIYEKLRIQSRVELALVAKHLGV